MPTAFSGTENQRPLLTVTRYALYALLVFTPLALASVQDWAVTVIHMITLIALTAFLLEKSITWDWKWIKTPLDKPIIFLLILSILSTVFSMNRPHSFWALILLLNYLVIFYLVIQTFRTRSHVRQLVYVIIGIAVFLSAFGFLKASGNNPFSWWDYKDISQDINRVSSTYGNPNHLAGYMEMALPMLLGLFLIGLRGITLFVMICLAVLLLATLIHVLSRGGWSGALGGLFFMGFALLIDRQSEKKKLLLAMVGGFVMVIFIVLSNTPVVERILTLERADKLEGRELIWSGIKDMIQDYPLLGTGPGTFSTVYTRYQPPGMAARAFYGHNDYLQWISETGLILVPVIIWMIVALFRKGFKKLKNPSRLVRGITIGALSGITAIMVHSFTDFNLHIPANALLFTVLTSLVVSPLPEPSWKD